MNLLLSTLPRQGEHAKPIIVYKTTNLINGKIYIGKAYGRRPGYLGSGKLIKQAILKYGPSNFKKEIIEVCKRENVYNREQFWIKKLGSQNRKTGYNLSDGGPGFQGLKLSEEHKRKIIAANKGKSLSPEHRQKLIDNHFDNSGPNAPWYGKHLTPEARQKISAALKGRKVPEERRLRSKMHHPWRGKHLSESVKKKISEAQLGNKNHMYGKTGKRHHFYGCHHTEESNRKNAMAHIGKRLSLETRKKLSISHSGIRHPMYGRFHSAESKAKMSISHKGRIVSEETKRKMSLALKGRVMPIGFREKIRASWIKRRNKL